MIKKLSKRIFMLIMISLSTIILGVILLFSILNYQNTINSRISMMDRFGKPEEIRNFNDISKLDTRKIEGVYDLIVQNSNVIEAFNDNKASEEIKKYAIEASTRNQETGIIGNYIYKVRKNKDGMVHVTLMEDENAVSNIYKIFGISGTLALISIIAIYGIAKKVSYMIVKPVEETFEKQKQFISDASHELKTPLAVIEANADVLENEVGKNKWLSYIQTEIDSMNKLINELLLLAKIENIDNIRETKNMDLSKQVNIIVSMFESMAYEKNVKLNSNIQENVMLNGNEEDIKHILSTLIDNAIKHTSVDGEVIVNLKKDKNEIALIVKNKGEQIPEEERQKIFERFYRIDKARNRQEKRYGLGLAICKSTVEKYNGKIDVDYKDGFTIFKVIIPA